CGAPFLSSVADTATSSARVSHFFGAVQVERFRDAAAFRQDMDRFLRELRQTPPAEGEERVYFAGQKEFECEAEAARLGVPLLAQEYDGLCAIGAARGVAAPHDVAAPPV
ncbi:MAG: Ldh family oxidoreductase, partial [Anaerolineales bacterium]|nr:Ldh family oxidoreductase [Anaerolineales bacterium]